MRLQIVGSLTVSLILMGLGDRDSRPRYVNPVEARLSVDGKRLFVLCQGTEELLVVDVETRSVTGRVAVGRVPRGLTLSADGKLAYVANSAEDTITEIDTVALRGLRTIRTGYEPSGVAVDGRGIFLYAANRIGNDVSVIDLKSGQEANRLLAGRGASYVAASPDGSRIFVTHIYPNPGGFRSAPVSEITEINTIDQIVAGRLRLHNAAGVSQVAISADGKIGLAAQMRPKNLIPLAHVAHSFAIANSIAVFGEGIEDAVQLPLDDLESHFSQPFGVTIAPDGTRAYVSASGTDEVAVLNLKKIREAAQSPEAQQLANDLSAPASYLLARIPVGKNPRGMALSNDGRTLYVANRLDDSVSLLDTRAMKVRGTILLGGPEEITPERRGEQLFYTSKFAFHHAYGCASCHIDSTFNGLAWDLEPDGFGIDIVDNRTIEDLKDTAPFKWNGGNPDLETECGPRTERFFYRSQSFDQGELSALVRYVKSIPPRRNRFRMGAVELTPDQERGKAIFERKRKKDGSPIPDELQCLSCHSGKDYTNLQMTDVGTGKSTDRSPLFDVPQLTNVALTAPYLHDGSAGTLEEIWTVFNPRDQHGVTNDLSKDELNALIEFLKTL